MNRLYTFLKQKDSRSTLSRSWSVSWPMILIMFFEFLIGLTDIFIAGRIGKEVQATYGFAVQLYFIFIILANALTVGTVSVVSRLFTSGNKDELYRAIFSSTIAATIAGAILTIGGLFLTKVLINLLNIPEELKPMAAPMMRIYAAGLMFHYVLINSNGILRSCNRIKSSLRTMALVCGINIALNFFFLWNTSLGFNGIALATASSVSIGSLVNLTHLKKVTEGGSLCFPIIKKMLHIGWPIGLLQALWQLSSMALFLILSSLPKNKIEILAAFSTGLRIESAIYLPAFAFNLANAVIMGNLIGEEKREEAFRSGIVTALIGVMIITGMVITVILNARWIVSFLSENGLVIEEAKKYLYISMLGEPIMAWGIILAGGLNGAGDTKSVLLRVALSVWLVRIPLCYFFVILLGFGAVSVWWTMNLSQLVQAFLISKRYLNRRWLQERI
ncbi:MAG: MATE family efflux transporter [Deltaproteobacteria bacterium RBG_16_48_10]|nr:MAG: MATE family efflux transporter [Deltaproteobacteria bacterium RBG_16_48_10]